jgi:hypothetical protein
MGEGLEGGGKREECANRWRAEGNSSRANSRMRLSGKMSFRVCLKARCREGLIK